MAIFKPLEDPNTGAPVQYPRITQMSSDWLSGVTVVQMRGYVSEAARRAGRLPIATDTVQLDGAPAADEDPRAWAYAQLTAPIAAAVDAEAGPQIVMSPSLSQRERWAGGLEV